MRPRRPGFKPAKPPRTEGSVVAVDVSGPQCLPGRLECMKVNPLTRLIALLLAGLLVLGAGLGFILGVLF